MIKLNYTYKKVTKKEVNLNRADLIDKRHEFSLKIAKCIRLNFLLVFIDETNFNLGLSARYGWSLRNSRCHAEH